MTARRKVFCKLNCSNPYRRFADIPHHLTQQHPAEAKTYLARMHRTEDISPVAAEAFEVVEREEDSKGGE
jgi:hypothetical protein